MFASINAVQPLGLAAAGLSSVFWTLAYLLIIRRAARDQSYGMPLVALAANLSWELIFLVVTIAKDGLDIRLALILPWTMFDFAIAAQCYRYGRRDFANLLVARYWPIALPLIVAFAAAVLLSIIHEFADAIGWYCAFGQNLMMSILFVAMFLRRDDLRGQSIYIAACKLLGTLFAFVLAVFWSPPTLHEHWTTLLPDRYTPVAPLIVTLYAGVFAFDVIYVAMLYRKRRDLGLAPWALRDA